MSLGIALGSKVLQRCDSLRPASLLSEVGPFWRGLVSETVVGEGLTENWRRSKQGLAACGSSWNTWPPLGGPQCSVSEGYEEMNHFWEDVDGEGPPETQAQPGAPDLIPEPCHKAGAVSSPPAFTPASA